MAESLCVVCQRRPPARGLVDDACRARYGRLLAEIPELYAQLAEPYEVPDRRHPDTVILSVAGQPLPLRDPVRAAVPSAAKAASNTGRVSGTPEAPVPVNLDLVDLTAPARAGSLLPHANADAGQRAAIVLRTRSVERHPYAARPDDQIGHLSVATTLDTWVRDWRLHRDKGEGWPAATVEAMSGWLADRLDDACDDHPAVDEFAAEVARTHSALRGVLGLTGPWPERLVGVPCRRCDEVALARMPVGHYGQQQYIECGACGDLLTPEEYERWTQLLAANVRGRRMAS